MKKIVTLLLILCMVGGIAAAQESFSKEADIINIETIDRSTFIRPFGSYEMAVSEFDIFGELGLPLGLNSSSDNLWVNLDLNIKATYNLGISPAGSMAIWLENWTYVPFGDSMMFPFNFPSSKPWSFTENLEMYMGAGVNYTHNLSFGDVYGTLVMPFILLGDDHTDPFDFAMLNMTLGMGTSLGVGGGLTLFNYINRNGENKSYFFNEVDVFVSYSTGPLSAKVTVNIPIENEIKTAGINIIPEAQYSLDNNITVFGAVPIQGVGREYDPTVGLKIGGKFGF
ncbi:MAG: hypothetical protein LBG94_05990 [Treponema sp.]|jgi:hypothetical protein|nr:hypothetical protein [Treponema sp.]